MSETAVIIFLLCKILLNFILLYLLIVFLICIAYCIAVIFFHLVILSYFLLHCILSNLYSIMVPSSQHCLLDWKFQT